LSYIDLMSLPRKSKESIASEIQYCSEITEKHWGMKLNLKTLDKQIASIISEKIEGYFYQRFRDWTVPDLLALREALGPADKESRKTDRQRYREELDRIAEDAAGISKD
jgi:hypothetical protein